MASHSCLVGKQFEYFGNLFISMNRKSDFCVDVSLSLPLQFHWQTNEINKNALKC